MEYSVVSKIIDLLVERCKDAFSGLKGKIKLHCIKKNLENEVFNEILSAHGDKVFYNDLDRFLVDNDVICNIIRNCCDTSVFHYKSNSQTINYYVHLFAELYPQYSQYHYEICVLLQKYFEVIYRTLNKSDNNETRIICNIVKELSHELFCELQDIKSTVEQIDRKVDVLVGKQELTSAKLSFDEYRKYLLCLYPLYPANEYLERKIYSKDECNTQLNALDVQQ